jgi:hypothetical protein
METSAKSNININEAFFYLAKEIKDKRMSEPQAPAGNIALNQPAPGAPSGKKKGGCCK